ncbi:MAG TPA: hypothetical protein VFB45_26590 [Pseudolabrys sp.]|nr:hypothetical protein [Pseudolabrys sp.]
MGTWIAFGRRGAGLAVAACTLLALTSPTLAQERKFNRDVPARGDRGGDDRGGGGGLKGVGTGLAIGVVTGIIINQLNQPHEEPRRGNAHHTVSKKKGRRPEGNPPPAT